MDTRTHTKSTHLDLCIFCLCLQDDVGFGGGLAGQKRAGQDTEDGLVRPSHLRDKTHLSGGGWGGMKFRAWQIAMGPNRSLLSHQSCLARGGTAAALGTQ